MDLIHLSQLYYNLYVSLMPIVNLNCMFTFYNKGIKTKKKYDL